MASVTEIMVSRFIEEKQIKHFSLEGISIDSDIEIKANEVIFIDDFVGSSFEYISSDEYFNESTQKNRITQNLGFIRFLSGTAFLKGLKLTITKYNYKV